MAKESGSDPVFGWNSVLKKKKKERVNLGPRVRFEYKFRAYFIWVGLDLNISN